MTSSNGNIFRVTGHLCGEFPGPRWIPHTKASDAELWCLLWCAPDNRLSKQSWSWWFETLSCPLWRHRNDQADGMVVKWNDHYDNAIMGAMASQITSLRIVYSTVYSGADQSKHQSSASLAFLWGIHRGPVNSPHKWPVTRKMFPFDDVIMSIENWNWSERALLNRKTGLTSSGWALITLVICAKDGW